jgi:hypothetical protein
MLVAELEACQVLEDILFPASMEGYVVSFMPFYEQGLACLRTSSSTRSGGTMPSSSTT